MVTLPFGWIFLFLPFYQQLAKAIPCQLDVCFRCLFGTFFKRMEYVYSFSEFGNIEDAVLGSGVNSKFIDSQPHTFHRFPIRGLYPLLHEM